MDITAAALVIQKLGPRQRGRILRHFLSLPESDRILRFGSSVSDEILQHYVESIDFNQDVVYGVTREKLASATGQTTASRGRNLLAVAHLAMRRVGGRRDAELGISVAGQARGMGLGSRIFEHVLQYCRSEQIICLYMHCLASNQIMLHIAQKAGMLIVRDHGEADAYLQFPEAQGSIIAVPAKALAANLVAA